MGSMGDRGRSAWDALVSRHHPCRVERCERLVAVAVEVYDCADGAAGRRPVPPQRPAQWHDCTGGHAPRQVERPAHQPGAPQWQRDQRCTEPRRPHRQQQILHRRVDRPIVAGDHQRRLCRSETTQTRYDQDRDLLEVIHLPLHGVELALHLRITGS